MVINSIFVYHFVDPDLRVEIIFRKEETTKNGGIDFEIGDIGEAIVSSKPVPEVFDMKYRSEFKHGFTNRGYLHFAILKALHSFQEKRAHKSRDMQFFLENVQNEILKIFKMFQNNMKFTRAAY